MPVAAEGVPDFRREAARQASFDGWPRLLPTVTELAAAGFFYTGIRDLVKCAFCQGILGEWEILDIPILEHIFYFTHCPFIKAENCGNIPMGDEPRDAPPQ